MNKACKSGHHRRFGRHEERIKRRDELLAWAKARDFRDRATEYLNRARLAPDGGVQRRFIDIARHYRILAAAGTGIADRLGDERRARWLAAK
jgi:hypothetical protein